MTVSPTPASHTAPRDQVIVTDTGFGPDTFAGPFTPHDSATGDTPAIDLPADTDPAALADLAQGPAMIRIAFDGFADGRGFGLARGLRLLGYAGRLRAAGDLLPDQYAMARRAGFDEVEIDSARAARQPEPDWLARADWRAHDYQSRLRG
ncbi:MAG: DUF934 domain-containing protein [Rhodobacteraceae bacterium]|nr:DUF934 domain-containing protein [Paracoccaceae bacterium]